MVYFKSRSQVGQKTRCGEGTRQESKGGRRKRKQNTGGSTRHELGAGRRQQMKKGQS